ncbi:hypothetical protein FOZ60_016716 [Perkinsus olseni]|uniref:Uncharacterized protein n=1 Tax=Perkinsus olseni TaxID=32597 RepID=A0A7J6P695_PEROL|nr:hypothetical protein FOZ60_016716 [Perkinsus olseni]
MSILFRTTMMLFYLTVLIIQVVKAPLPFPEGKYVGGQTTPRYLRIEADFVAGSKPSVHLSISCGSPRKPWDAWFDLERSPFADMFQWKDYQRDPKYTQLITFYNANCGGVPARRGDLVFFAKDKAENQYSVKIAPDEEMNERLNLQDLLMRIPN